MNFQHIMGAVIIIALVIIIGIYAGKKVNSASDFASASRRASLFMVMGALIGTLVGGASTIGTAQLAFSYGFSAWWFTLGGGLGLIVMAVFYIKPVYNAKAITIPGIISLEYGEKAGFTLAVLSSVGSFITISVSGRGMSAPGPTSNSKPRNGALPRMYWIGSPFSRRRMRR